MVPADHLPLDLASGWRSVVPWPTSMTDTPRFAHAVRALSPPATRVSLAGLCPDSWAQVPPCSCSTNRRASRLRPKKSQSFIAEPRPRKVREIVTERGRFAWRDPRSGYHRPRRLPLPPSWQNYRQKITPTSAAPSFSAPLLRRNAARSVLLSDGVDTAGHALESGKRLAATRTGTLGPCPERSSQDARSPRRNASTFHASSRPAQGGLRPYGNLRSNVATSTKGECCTRIKCLVESATSPSRSATTPSPRPNQNAEGTFVTYEVEIIPQQEPALRE